MLCEKAVCIVLVEKKSVFVAFDKKNRFLTVFSFIHFV